MTPTELLLLDEIIRIRDIAINKRAKEILDDAFNYGISNPNTFEGMIKAREIALHQLKNDKMV